MKQNNTAISSIVTICSLSLTHTHTLSLSLSVSLFLCLSVCLSVCLFLSSLSPSTCLSVSLSHYVFLPRRNTRCLKYCLVTVGLCRLQPYLTRPGLGPETFTTTLKIFSVDKLYLHTSPCVDKLNQHIPPRLINALMSSIFLFYLQFCLFLSIYAGMKKPKNCTSWHSTLRLTEGVMACSCLSLSLLSSSTSSRSGRGVTTLLPSRGSRPAMATRSRPHQRPSRLEQAQRRRICVRTGPGLGSCCWRLWNTFLCVTR